MHGYPHQPVNLQPGDKANMFLSYILWTIEHESKNVILMVCAHYYKGQYVHTLYMLCTYVRTPHTCVSTYVVHIHLYLSIVNFECASVCVCVCMCVCVCVCMLCARIPICVYNIYIYNYWKTEAVSWNQGPLNLNHILIVQSCNRWKRPVELKIQSQEPTADQECTPSHLT